ncbi:hypothetical protein Ciccas_008692 [Cichlidogyrus casuarinus]|uniref:Uncharacterized protein n=1 Tax=Cichlidogyrus casuarinus TaxID=1844966 RepID=A0ABD2PZL5_9PLAT
MTPNPDILCNRLIKFDLLYKQLIKDNSFDAFATGHYAQNSYGNFLQLKPENTDAAPADLYRSRDPVKDQSFWLCTVDSNHLRHCMFPIGDMLKPQVKRLANEVGLSQQSKRRESMGICFIGKRTFASFIDQYIPAKPGPIQLLETGEVIGQHSGIHHFTLGQRVPIERMQGPFYVAKLDSVDQSVKVVRFTNNPHLFMRKCVTGPSIWTNPANVPQFTPVHCDFQWQNKWMPIPSTLRKIDEQPPSYDSRIGSSLHVELGQHMRCIAPGQWAAFYRGDKCLGGAQIMHSQSLVETDSHTQLIQDFKPTDYETSYANVTPIKRASFS